MSHCTLTKEMTEARLPELSPADRGTQDARSGNLLLVFLYISCLHSMGCLFGELGWVDFDFLNVPTSAWFCSADRQLA